jgi:two-component system sensor histidine kinase ChvG
MEKLDELEGSADRAAGAQAGPPHADRPAGPAAAGETVDAELSETEAAGRPGFAARSRRFLRLAFLSSLSRRIFGLNLAALAVLLSGILYLNQFSEGLIEARIESLLTQGRIIAGAIASSATVESDRVIVDPETLLEQQAGETAPDLDSLDTLDSPIREDIVGPLLRGLIQPTRTRARIYDRGGVLVLDSAQLYSGGEIRRFDLPAMESRRDGMIALIGRVLNGILQRRDLPVYEELSGRGTDYPEVAKAVGGEEETVVRITRDGELIVSVAVPIQRYRAIHGSLLLSTQGGDIDRIVAEERIAILRVFLVAVAVTTLLSGLLAATIANPLRKLAEAAVRVRRGVKERVQIPDFSRRQDEIGDLSVTLRAMTNALYARIEAIESFAADVSHELKNPLTSLRSAVETLPLARNDGARQRLMDVIQHDVKRLDRLITDISDASRLDAELARADATPLDLEVLVRNMVAARAMASPKGRAAEIRLDVARQKEAGRYVVSGHEGRIGQVLANLLDNAGSFVPSEGGRIDIRLKRDGDFVELSVEDNGPGIVAENLERVFERFYTDRPAEEGFGHNSGLGLSISRQIVEAHGGTIRAANRMKPATGARFVVRLPAAA